MLWNATYQVPPRRPAPEGRCDSTLARRAMKGKHVIIVWLCVACVVTFGGWIVFSVCAHAGTHGDLWQRRRIAERMLWARGQMRAEVNAKGRGRAPG